MMTVTTHVSEPIDLQIADGRPARFWWREGWKVTTSTADAFEFLGQDVRVVRWLVTAQTDDLSDVGRFELARDFDRGGWLLEQVTYA